MAVLKCKMCGGDLQIAEGATTATCDYCGIVQTIPKADDEKKLLQFERAERLRKQCEFDKAAGIYESIVADFRDEAEAYWGLVLCKYGIEYVDDPATGRKVPTCHRSGYDSVLKDIDFEQALENAGPIARQLYRGEAKKIEALRQEIIAVSANEEPYDIFICYKETDLNGNRTLDSVLAQDIYDTLTEKGYRVFFSRISLEDKLGQAYEPYIFAALHSAKIMLAVGTDYEHYNAVWVKNEWSRFLKLTAADKSKHLIPCYKNIDAYDMPEEFAHLQAQDLGKVGATQDLLRGIEKLLPRLAEAVDKVSESAPVVEVPAAAAGVNSYLERAFLFLEEANFVKAREYLEKVLDIDPKNGQAYLGKLLADLRVRSPEFLANQRIPFDTNPNYEKAIRFGDAKLQRQLMNYIANIKEQNETARLEKTYSQAVDLYENAKSVSACTYAIQLFKSIPGYKDTEEKLVLCNGKLESLQKARSARRQKQKGTLKTVGRVAAILSAVLALTGCIALLVIYAFIPNGKYNDAKDAMNAGRYKDAIAAFDVLDGFRDSEDQARSAYQLHKISDLKNAAIGDTIFFGTYTDDCLGYRSYDRDGHLEWLVLDKKDGKLLVISRYTLGYEDYDDYPYGIDATWETCTLREWLNNKFLNAIFSADEQAMIPTVTVPAEANPVYGTYPGNDTQDKVFILSINEVNRYFGSDAARQTHSGLPGELDDDPPSSSDTWWLRNPGENTSTAAYVYNDGSLSIKGCEHDGFPQVRPAMWIDLGD